MDVDSEVEMLTVLIGNDDFEIESICSEIKQTVLPEELKDINTIILDGATINFQDLISHCNTIPFMSNLRLVIVNDFASVIFGTSQSSTKSNSDKSDLSVVKEFLDSVPDTTHLVMIDDNLPKIRGLSSYLKTHSQFLQIQLPKMYEMPMWIQNQARKIGISIDQAAVSALVESIGNNKRNIDQELTKLSLYSSDGKIALADVKETVAVVREASIFAAVDSIFDGNPDRAFNLIQRVLDDGNTPQSVILMIVRQLRFLMLCKDFRLRGVSGADIGKRLNVPGFVMKKIFQYEKSIGMLSLISMHKLLLEADYALKSVSTPSSMILDLLIVDLCTKVNEE